MRVSQNQRACVRQKRNGADRQATRGLARDDNSQYSLSGFVQAVSGDVVPFY